MPAPADVAVVAGEPDLLQMGSAPGYTLPQGRPKCVARLVQGQRLEGVLHLAGDLGVGEPPRAVLLAEAAWVSQLGTERGGETYWSAEPRTPITGAGGIPSVPTVSHTASALTLISVTPS